MDSEIIPKHLSLLQKIFSKVLEHGDYRIKEATLDSIIFENSNTKLSFIYNYERYNNQPFSDLSHICITKNNVEITVEKYAENILRDFNFNNFRNECRANSLGITFCYAKLLNELLFNKLD